MSIEDFNNENYVAHYTKFDTVVEHILPTNKIKISSIKNMNDPYENKQHWFDGEPTDDSKIKMQYQQIQTLKTILFDSIKIFSTAGYKENKNSIGLVGHLYCRPRMWAQYGLSLIHI